jgi:MFS family permease
MLFTPMPLFVSDVVKSAAIPTGFVFVVFMLSSGGGVLSYFFISHRSDFNSGKSGLQRILLLRGLFSFLLLGVSVVTPFYGVSLLTLILVLLGVANAFFVVLMLSISMELMPAGKAGLFNVLVGVGGACGSLTGPLIASQQWGFAGVFVVAGAIFLAAYVFLKWFF